MTHFNVTYEIVTPESAENGDSDESGFISEGVSLRKAIDDLFATRTSKCGGVASIENNDRWITVYNGTEFLTGAQESRSLHFPQNITAASKARIWAIVNV